MSAKSVIEIWLSGGPSSLESFDPKPNASSDYNNGLKAIPTNVDGISIHEWWPNLAKCADTYSIIRTMTHPHFGHETATYLMQTGRDPGGGDVYPAIGTVISMLKAKDYHGDLPASVILTGAKGRFSEVGFLGEQYSPLVTGGNPNFAKFIVDGIVPPGGLTHDEVNRRFDLLSVVDRFGRPEEFKDFESAGISARQIIDGDAAKTFDLSQEPAELRDLYGRSWIGQSLLAARRLVEYGVPYITVNMSGWDSHKRHFETMKQRIADTDRAVAALLGDLKNRGLLDTTIVWMSGEFGRTTKIERDPPWNGGRGHYPKCFCSLVAGGGFQGGMVVGESDETATNVVKRPVTPVDFLGSIYELCGINPDSNMPNPLGRKLPILPKQAKPNRLRELYRKLATYVAMLAIPFALNAADPYVGYIYPSGIQAGTTNRMVVGGQFIHGCKDVIFSGDGLKVINIEQVPNFPPPESTQRKYLIQWLKNIAGGNRHAPPIPEQARIDEWRSNVWWKALGELDDQKLSLVELDLFTKRNALQMTPSLRQRLLVTIVADTNAKEGPREMRLSGWNGMSPPRPFFVTSAPRRQEPRFAAPFHKQPDIPQINQLPAILDGCIMPGQIDQWALNLTKGKTISLQVIAREYQPYIGDAVPGFFNAILSIKDPHGNIVALSDDYHYHPDPVTTFTPKTSGQYMLEIRDVLYRGREDFIYSISITESDDKPDISQIALWNKPNLEIPQASIIKEFNGKINHPGKSEFHEMDITQPGEYVFDLLARRYGSPLDAKIEIFTPDGALLAGFSDVTNSVHFGSIIQEEIDPIGCVDLPTIGKYCIKISDECGKGGIEWTYKLRVHKPAPRFEVWMSPSSFTLRPWGRKNAHVTVIRKDGFHGDVQLIDTPLLHFDPSVIPAGSNTMNVAIVSKAHANVPHESITIRATAEINGVTRTEYVTPADTYNQAFAWDHLLPARSFEFRGLAPKDKQKNNKPNNKKAKRK